MRHRSTYAQSDRSLDVAMTPMIDVVFMLLIFFVWTASFQAAELMLPSSLISDPTGVGQTSQQSEWEDLERVVVRILWRDKLPQWYVNDQPVATLEQVAQRLNIVAQIQASLPVLVDPDPSVPLGDVIDVYDLARVAGFENVQFATPAP